MKTPSLRNLLRAALVSVSAATAFASGVTFAAAAPDLTVVEYFHRPTDHYFITASPSEQSTLDALPASVGFARTGRSFSAWSTAQLDRPTEAVAVERFFVPALSSHVFTASAKEIAALRALPVTSSGAGFVDEGIAFFALQPVDGRCASGLKAVYRAYNNRHDGNHRYTTDIALQAVMVSGGFVNEDVAFCSNVVGEDAGIEKSAGTPRPTGEDITVAGTVSSIVSISNFMLGTQRVNAANARFEHGAPAALVNGLAITVEGVIVNGVLMAREVTLPESTPLTGDEIKGFINAVGTNGALFVNGQSVDVSNATITGGTAAQLVVGVQVELQGAFLNGVFKATLVHIEDAKSSTTSTSTSSSSSSSSSTDAELKGAVSGFVSVANFTVQGQVVDAHSAVFEDGSASDVANGAVVEVHGRIVSGVLIASRVQIKSTVIATGPTPPSPPSPPSAGVEFEATGAVTNFVSIASFKLAGTLINATNASFERGTAANLGNGVAIEVRGTLSNGVVTATRVRFER